MQTVTERTQETTESGMAHRHAIEAAHGANENSP